MHAGVRHHEGHKKHTKKNKKAPFREKKTIFRTSRFSHGSNYAQLLTAVFAIFLLLLWVSIKS
jgi:hypothetical protein